MAPAVVAPSAPAVDIVEKKLEKVTLTETRTGNKFGYVPGIVQPTPEDDIDAPYHADEFLPSFPNKKWEPLEDIEYHDKGLLGHPEFKNLLEDATAIFDYGPRIGTEIHGIRLKNLTDAQKNDLARLTAYRGVVFFRDQEDFTIEDQLALGRYWGPLHAHATTAMPKREGLNEIHVVYADKNSKNQQHFAPLGYFWHSDVTYEKQPPSYTTLKGLTIPASGGDTIWNSGYASYDALSPAMQRYVESLSAVHSAEEQAAGSRRAGNPVRREPVTTVHPLVRTHPVTGWKSLFYNPGFVTGIVGVPKHESNAILKYLNEVVCMIPENQARFQWRRNDVVLWDNRVTNHTATYDLSGRRRHGVRVTPHGEKPYLDPNSGSQEEDLHKALGLPPRIKDASGKSSNYND